jgi:RND family efflux transporter MFP subunit
VEVETSGIIQARKTVELRPQVAGTVREITVREGDTVRAGQLILRLDDRNERAQLERARAQLLKDEAALEDAERQARRSRELLAQGFISQGAVDAALTAVQSQKASVASAKAAVQAAEVTLQFTTLSAPQSGRLGAIPVQVGSYVSPTGNAVATLSETDPVLVVFSVPQRLVGKALSARERKTPVVSIRPADGLSSPLAPAVPLSFVDNTVDAATGTLRLKAEVSNPESQWWPGAHVQVRFSVGSLDSAVVVPVAAVVQSARGQSVFIVDEEGKAQAVKVEVLEVVDGQAAVKGLAAGKTVVLEGRQSLRAGTPVVDRSKDRKPT